MNGCIWDQELGEAIGQVHRGEIDLNSLRCRIIANLNNQIPLVNAGIDTMLAARDYSSNGTPMSRIIAQVTSDMKVTKKQASGVLTAFLEEKGEVGELANSAFGVANAFTRYGQTTNDSDWVKFDEFGGKIISMKRGKWDSTVERAKHLGEKDLERIFGSVVA
jgi:hypothetical protein